MANDIKQRIVLEGEKEYNAALAEARRNLKTLRSELKAETAELGANATAQQKNEVKIKSLQKQIKEQEKVVKTYEAALAEVRDKYGDNAEAVARYEQRLNDARTTLANMKNSLEQTGQSMKSVESSAQMGVVAANSFADSLGKVAEAGSLISGALENAFKGVVGVISTAIQDVWGEVLDVAAKADNYLDLASFLGASATDVQKWSKALEMADTDISSAVNLISRLKYGGKADKVTEWFGLSGENYTNDLEYFNQLLSIASEKRDEMIEAGTWDEAMSEIFGAKKVQDFENMLSDWEQIQKGLETFNADEGGYGLTEDEIEKMGALNEQVAMLEAKWNALKEMATVKLFADLAMNITGNLENIVDAFKEYFEADSDEGRDEALKKIKENIVEIIQTVRDAIQEGLTLLEELAEEFKGSEDSTVRAIGNVLGAIVDALEWFAKPENWEAVKVGFETLIGIWATGKIVSALGHLASFAAHITTISTALGGSGGLAALSGLGSAAGSAVGGVKAAASGAFIPVAVVAAGILPAILAQRQTIDEWKDQQKTREEAAALAKELGDAANAQFMAAAAAAVGPQKDENGEYKKNILGQEYTQMTDEYDDLLMGLQTRQNEEKAKLYNLIHQYADSTAGYDTWNLLNDYWNGAQLDPYVVNELLQNITDAMMRQTETNAENQSSEVPAAWWTSQQNNDGLKSEDIAGFRGLPAQMLKAVASGAASGMSGISVNLDGQKVGTLVAPYVSQEIARDIP